ncbi:type I-E CRISPR-associated protein Cas6/Cse3/CasE [Streptomyces sp. NPDC059814]
MRTSRPDSGSAAGSCLARAEIKGTLTLTDPRTFVTALTQGVGHARAYSCGL